MLKQVEEKYLLGGKIMPFNYNTYIELLCNTVKTQEERKIPKYEMFLWTIVDRNLIDNDKMTNADICHFCVPALNIVERDKATMSVERDRPKSANKLSDLINLRNSRITQYYTYYCNSIYTSKFRENDYKYVNQYLTYLLVKYGHIEKTESLFDLIGVAKQWVKIMPKLYNGLKKYKKSYENHNNKDLYNIICKAEELSNGFMQQDINNYIENIEKNNSIQKKKTLLPILFLKNLLISVPMCF